MSFSKFIIKEKLEIHEELNPLLWDKNILKKDVKIALNNTAKEFISFLKIKQNLVKDIVFVGSNANYNFHSDPSSSDIDIHIEIDIDGFDCFDITEYLLTKKTLWNSQHNITVNQIPIELYAEGTSDKEVSNQGVYSLMQDKWLIEPSKIRNLEIDQPSIDRKVNSIKHQINNIVDSKCDNLDTIKHLKDNIKKLRQTGITKGGEFSTNNLAFKELRDDGYLEKLSTYEAKLEDNKLSL